MTTIAERVATALSEETGVTVESITVTRDGAWWEAECDGIRGQHSCRRPAGQYRHGSPHGPVLRRSLRLTRLK